MDTIHPFITIIFGAASLEQMKHLSGREHKR
jgi:hypothetical protein